MNMKLDGSAVAVLAGIGLGAYWLYKYRPAEVVTQVIDNTIAQLENALDGDDNGQLDFMTSILGGTPDMRNWTEAKKVYEVDTDKNTLNAIFIGSKPFAVPIEQMKNFNPSRGVYAAPLPTPLGRITAKGGPFWTTDSGRSNAGTLNGNGHYDFIYEGKPKATINGDPRALYCIDALMKASGLKHLNHAGLALRAKSEADMKKDYGHRRGHAIDLTNDVQMNALIEAAKRLGMPIGWIGKGKVTDPITGKTGWGKWLLKDGLKLPMGVSSINHDSHYHLILPRPNRALGYWIGSPFTSTSWNPAEGGSNFTPGNGGSSDWGATPGFIPDNPLGNPPPINED